MPKQGSSLRESLTSERERRVDERIAGRARLRKLLHKQLQPRVQNALNALRSEPPLCNVARDWLDRTLIEIADECARLDAEDRVDRQQ